MEISSEEMDYMQMHDSSEEMDYMQMHDSSTYDDRCTGNHTS
jgi:hypothetical protein